MTDTVKFRGNLDTVRGTWVFGGEAIKTIKDTSDAGIEVFGELQSVMSQQILQEEAFPDSNTACDHLFGADLFKNL